MTASPSSIPSLSGPDYEKAALLGELAKRQARPSQGAPYGKQPFSARVGYEQAVAALKALRAPYQPPPPERSINEVTALTVLKERIKDAAEAGDPVRALRQVASLWEALDASRETVKLPGEA